MTVRGPASDEGRFELTLHFDQPVTATDLRERFEELAELMEEAEEAE